MTMISAISRAPKDAYAQLVRELQEEFDCLDVEALAERIVEAEATDFHWEARVRERYLGQHFGCDFEGEAGPGELSRVAIMSVLDGRWYVAMCLVDGEGAAVELVWKREFEQRGEAEFELLRAR